MAVASYVVEILDLRRLVLELYSRPSSQNRSSYYKQLLCSQDVLLSVPRFQGIEKNEMTYVRNYFYATLISLFMEKEGYDLTVWDDFIKVVHPHICTLSPYSILFGTKVSSEGGVLELLILQNINLVFRLQGITAVKVNSDSDPTYLFDDYKNRPFSERDERKIIDKLKITMKIRGVRAKPVWGDNDIVVVASDPNTGECDAICIISSKTSLRERVYQSIFWATHSRIEGIGKHTFVTLDKGDDKGNTEIGNRGGTTRKTRDVLESTMDRVYVFRNAGEVGRSPVIKDFE